MSAARWRLVAGVALGSLAAHCALVYDPDALGLASAAGDGGAADATTREDGAAIDAIDAAGPSDAGGDGLGPTGLDEHVALADLDAAPCTVSSTGNDPKACGASRACRFATADSGRCESCDGGAGRCTGNLGAPCTDTWDCDTLFACFRGECANQCDIGNVQCGGVEACVDVGYLGGVGICDPAAR